MNGYIKSPWAWNEIFENCVKYLLLMSEGKIQGGVNGNDIDELYFLSSTESDEIYLNSTLVETYSDISGFVFQYERENGEIKE